MQTLDMFFLNYTLFVDGTFYSYSNDFSQIFNINVDIGNTDEKEIQKRASCNDCLVANQN